MPVRLPRLSLLLSAAALCLIAGCEDPDATLVTATQDAGAARTAPVIDQQPQPIAVAEGESAMFIVQASGRGPLSYQWQRNGTAIAGANRPVHRIHAATRGDDQGQYSVVVTNDGGRAASSAATLIVTPRDETVAWQ
jgi:hypothetical protein